MPCFKSPLKNLLFHDANLETSGIYCFPLKEYHFQNPEELFYPVKSIRLLKYADNS